MEEMRLGTGGRSHGEMDTVELRAGWYISIQHWIDISIPTLETQSCDALLICRITCVSICVYVVCVCV